MKTAVVYARYSCDNQTEQSIEGQLRVCEDFAQRNNILILNTYIDRAMTGTNDLRPDFQRMLKDSNKKEWDYVLVYKLDRFSRNKYESVMHKRTLKENGVKVLSAMENIPDTPEGIILESLLEGMNQYYSVELAQKVRRGLNESRLKGYFTGGKLLYGYALSGKYITIDENKANVVRYMFKQYALGMPVRKIINDLTNQGILHNGKPFKHNTVYKILKNEKYTGICRIQDKVYDKLYPQIIDKETYQMVQDKNKENQYGKFSIISVYLFKNKLKCGYCGHSISAECARTRNGTKLNYYKCIGIKKYRNGCVKETIRQEVLEKFLLDLIIEELSKSKTIDNIVRNLMELQDNMTNTSLSLNILLKDKKRAETNLNNILLAIEQGVVNKTTNTRMKELEEQIEYLYKNIIIEKSKTSMKISEEEIRKYFKIALEQEPLALINYVIKEIKLYNDKAEITFNSPIKSFDNNNQGFSFLSTNKYMERIMQHKEETLKINMTINFYI
ncbi:MAG: recombinase family protein [Clostridia bacterium]|nr:recombinase family protein [Clostridia bacterium]